MSTLKKRVSLWDMCGVAAIILEDSDVIYYNQTGGTTCLHSEAEGILVFFNNDPPLASPELSFEHQLTQLFNGIEIITEDLAKKLDQILASYNATACAKVDRHKMRESREAWVYITIKETEQSIITGFGNCSAVLTWPNSD
jgi:hypothetical protein